MAEKSKTIADLKAELQSLGVAFKAKAKKSELETLLADNAPRTRKTMSVKGEY